MASFAQGAAGQQRSASPTAGSTSPADPSGGPPVRSPFGLTPGLGASAKMSGATRSGAGSPSHDMGGAGAGGARLFPKR